MWKPWKNTNEYKKPPKPRNPNKQLSMIWEQAFNHIPGELGKMHRRLYWQDVKLNFMLVLLALILASLGTRLFL